jgi:hypothetical protein
MLTVPTAIYRHRRVESSDVALDIFRRAVRRQQQSRGCLISGFFPKAQAKKRITQRDEGTKVENIEENIP